MLAAGIMSGTSLDGIDVVLVEIEGVDLETKLKVLAFETSPYPAGLGELIAQQCQPDLSSVDQLCSLNVALGHAYAAALQALCHKQGIETRDLAFVASHGQTLYHMAKPDKGLFPSSLQLGDPAIMAESLQTTIISDFRLRDMAVGGQGAPLVPFSEYVLYGQTGKDVFLQNIGGIGNVTYIPQSGSMEDMLAFDTGPGNMIMNYMAQHYFGLAYDPDGQYASQGKVDYQLLTQLQDHPYLSLPLPKSTGREDFGPEFCQSLLESYPHLSGQDMLATVTYFTAYCIQQGLESISWSGPARLIVGGGGAYNLTLLAYLRDLLPGLEVLTQEDLGYSSEAKEAIAFAVLGNQTYHRRPSNVPAATGARSQVILGSLTYY